MKRVTLTVNGEAVTAEVAPRTHLADFLREERLLTGTHLGCEHGVCGACTLLIDGVPARSCITFAVTCQGSDVRTIEGLEDDPMIVRLRAAFTEEHALQCGYCTPGMLVVARDIVRRLPNADEARIRLELAGNLCRCTGYAGIVRAIKRVLGDGASTSPAVKAQLPSLPPMQVAAIDVGIHTPASTEFARTLRLSQPMAAVWSALHDPYLIADCIPGARITDVVGDRFRGEVKATLGPIETSFVGSGTLNFDDALHRVVASGESRDARTGTRLSGRITMHLREATAMTTEAEITIEYSLRGPLAHFARGMIVQEFVAVLAAAFDANFEARLSGANLPAERRIAAGLLLMRAVWRRLRAVLGLG